MKYEAKDKFEKEVRKEIEKIVKNDKEINLINENGEKHGYWEELLPTPEDSNDPPIIDKGNYVNGKKEGKWLSFEDGKLFMSENYINDLRDGASKIFNEDGSISTERNFQDGVKHGSSIDYDLENTITLVTEYEKGKVVNVTNTNTRDSFLNEILPKVKKGDFSTLVALGKATPEHINALVQTTELNEMYKITALTILGVDNAVEIIGKELNQKTGNGHKIHKNIHSKIKPHDVYNYLENKVGEFDLNTSIYIESSLEDMIEAGFNSTYAKQVSQLTSTEKKIITNVVAIEHYIQDFNDMIDEDNRKRFSIEVKINELNKELSEMNINQNDLSFPISEFNESIFNTNETKSAKKNNTMGM